MKKLLTLLLFVLSAGLLSIEKAEASHCQGADLTYTYTGNPNEYLVTLRFYRDCYGISAPGIATICYSSANAGVSSTIDLYPIPGTGGPIAQSLCVNTAVNCSQSTGGNGTEEWIFQGTVVLPSAQTDWIFGYELCCRNTAITTLTNPGGAGLFVSTYLNNLDFPTNSSPVFSSIPVTVFCVNNQFFYPQGATDIDGDSLHYTLVGAQDATGFCPYTPVLLTYAATYSATNPLTTLSGTILDQNTGLITFTPTLVQVGVICVLVEEYDTTQVPAVKKGSVKRDLQVVITPNCNVVQPFPSQLDSTVINGTTYSNVLYANCADTSIIVTLSQDVQCFSIASNGSDFRAIRPNGQPNPIFHAEAVNCVNGQTDSVRVYLYYPLTQTISKLYIKMGTDTNTMLSECGNSIYETNGSDTSAINDTINIIVLDTSVIELKLPVQAGCVFSQVTVHFLDQMLCSSIKPNGSDFKLVDSQGTVFPVASAYGACSGGPSSSTQDITVVFATSVIGVSPYYLISLTGSDNNTLSNFCETYINAGDTIAIIDASQPLLLTLGPDVNQCISDPFPVLNAQLPGLTYTWTLNGTVLPNDTTQYITASQAGTYIVNVMATAGCQGSDTVVVSFIPAPVADILANGISTGAVTICQGSPYPVLNGTSAGATSYNWLLNGSSVSINAVYTPTADGQYILEVSSGGTCLGIDTITINTIAQVVVNLGNDITQCSNIPNPILDAGGFAGAAYLWSTGETTQMISPGTSGTYIVTVTYGGSCSATDTLLLTVNTTPSTPALQDQSICYNGTPGTLNANPAGVQPPTATYSWTDASGNIVGSDSLFTPSAAGTYTVTITNNGCIITDDAVLTIEPAYNADAGTDQASCETDSVQLSATSSSTLSTTFAWSLNNTPYGTGSQVYASLAGTYSVIVTDQHGCTAADSTVLNVEDLLPAPVPVCTSEPSGRTVYTWNTVPGNQGYEVSLDGGNTWIPANTPTGPESHQVTTPATSFIVRALGTLCPFGAKSEPAPCSVEIPNVVTPNGDGINDEFTIKNLDQYQNVKLQIFNRWGNIIYTDDNYGINNNYGFKDEADGTYFYVLDIPGVTEDDVDPKFNYPEGIITVIREKK